MFKLPENKPQKPKDTPRNFFVWGETMSGKSYLANEFPNPIVLNTDGNAEANTIPSIQVRNYRNANGRIEKGAPEIIGEVLLALQTQNHTYETVVVDVIDDVVELFKQYICVNNGVKSLGDVPYGKAYDEFNALLTQMVLDLKALPMNVVYISRQVSILDKDGKTTIDVPSLKDKYVNIINGNCDLNVQARRLGNKYLRRVEARRKNYKRDEVDDAKILKILDTISGAFDKPVKQDDFL